MKLLSDLGDEVSSARISYHAKDTMRNNIKNIKKGIDYEGRARKNAVMGEVVETAKALLEANPSLPYLVYHLEAFANNKAVDGALKQVKALVPDSVKILCMAQCSSKSVAAGLKANDWCSSVSTLINGKGGGKPEEAMEIDEKFIHILKVGKVTVAPFTASTRAPAA